MGGLMGRASDYTPKAGDNITMPVYYHATKLDFAQGDILAPGRYGEFCRAFKAPQRQYMFEQACEDIRAAHFPQSPSRLNCVYACEDLAGLEEFDKKTGGNRDHYYEIGPVDEGTPKHRGTWDLRYGVHLHGMVNCSWIYWSQHHARCVEILIGGDVRILRKIR